MRISATAARLHQWNLTTGVHSYFNVIVMLHVLNVIVRAFNLCQCTLYIRLTDVVVRESVRVCEHSFMHYALCIFANRGHLQIRT